ncbi:MAG: hypothetical protein AAF570_10790 [Bacteroidota bacterium]
MGLLSAIFSVSEVLGQNLEVMRTFVPRSLASGDNEEALRTGLRVLYFSEPGERGMPAYWVGEAFSRLGEHAEAVQYFQFAAALLQEDSLVFECQMKWAKSYLELGKPEKALWCLGKCEANSAVERKRLGFYLGLVEYARKNDSAAVRHFSNCAESPFQAAKVRDIFGEMGRLKRKKPVVATVLSYILPGAGQIYGGDVKNALNSVLLTAAFTGLGIYVWTAVGVLEAGILVAPWLFRYYRGGATRAGHNLRNRQAEKRDMLFRQMLEVLEGKW